MTDNNKPYVIVVGVDFSESGDIALEAAFQLADERYPADVHVVNVLPAYIPSANPGGQVWGAGVAPSLGEANTRLRNYVEEKLVAHQDKGVRRAWFRDCVCHCGTRGGKHGLCAAKARVPANDAPAHGRVRCRSDF